MKNEKKMYAMTIGIIVSILTVGFLSSGRGRVNTFDANASNSYSLTLSSEKNRLFDAESTSAAKSGNATLYTDFGDNPIEVAYSGFLDTAIEGVWHTLQTDASFEVTDVLSGISSIKITASSAATIGLYWSFNGVYETSNYASLMLEADTTYSYAFDSGSLPNYFRLLNEGGEVAITGIEASYACSNVDYAIAAPSISLSDSTISWDAVTNAESYEIYADGTLLDTVTQTSYTLSITDIGVYSIYVKAITTKTGFTDSEASSSLSYIVYPSVISTATSWDRDGLYGDDWTRTGSFDTGVGEGCDMKAGARMIMAHAITSSTSYLEVPMRVFYRTGETYPEFYVYVNENLVRADGYSTDYVTTISVSFVTFAYNLSDYVGQTVLIEFYEAASTHTVLNNVALSAAPELSETTSWTGVEFAADANVWFTDRDYASKSEGADLKGGYYAWFQVSVTSELRYLNVGVRMYAGQDTAQAYMKVVIDGTAISATNSDYTTFPIPLSDSIYIYTYDLNDCVGTNVFIKITNESATNHMVLTSIALGDSDNHTASDNTFVSSFDFTTSGNGRSLWTITGSNTGVGEGADLQGGQRSSYGSMSYSTAVLSDYEFMKVKGRMFNGQDSNDGSFTVTVGGTTVYPVGSSSDATLSCTTDNSSIYYYDLSDYIDTTVNIVITCTSNTYHCVIQTIDFVATSAS